MTHLYCLENLSFSQNPHYRSIFAYSTNLLTALLVATGGLGIWAKGAIAQIAPDVNYNSTTGAVEVDNNAFQIRTGPLTNTSNIELPALLPEDTSEGRNIPVFSDQLAPNRVEIRPDVDYINESFDTLVNQAATGTTYTLQSDSLQLNTQFVLERRPSEHFYGQGVETTVSSPDAIVSNQSTFVRGDVVTRDANGQSLPESTQIDVNYGAEDRVDLRVLHIVRNGALPAESGIYFSADGEFIVEDGFDRDFHDGDYVQVSGGQGRGQATRESTDLSEDIQVFETPLAPAVREEEIVETDLIENTVQFDAVLQEEEIQGEVAPPEEGSTRLGHADGVVTAERQQLVYNRYAATNRIRAGSDGFGLSGQLAPLVINPNVPPTLLSGNLTFNPTVGDNEAGLSATLGVTQFFTPTHRLARDVLGNIIENPDANGPTLVEPVGLFSNQRLVGYVPATPEEIVPTSPLSSTRGVFELPSDQPIIIEPLDPARVGSGNAAYTDNVGGLLIERATGGISFVPQWTKAGYAETPISLSAGEALRIIHALVPQQANQDLQLGETYAVTVGTDSYEIEDGGFSIISADRQPQNFLQETSEVYAVEDTVAAGNAAIPAFSGIQGTYAERPGGPLVPTVDVELPDEVDARVGNRLYSPVTLAGNAGQSPYSRTTRAVGFYLGGTLSGGVGNQRNTINRATGSVTQAADSLLTRRTLNTFRTPRWQRDTIITQTTELTRAIGNAFFDINRDGELTNARFDEESSEIVSSSTEVKEERAIVSGDESLMSTTRSEDIQVLEPRIIEVDEVRTTTQSEAYPNFSTVQGELALGGVLNFGNTPWSMAANTLRAELFARDTVLGRSQNGSEVGWRAEVVFHPFGEVQRVGYQYDAAGIALPLYATEPVFGPDGERVIETLVSSSGEAVEVPVSEFVQDDSGDFVPQTVGTGQANGPGVYLRVEDVFRGGRSAEIAGGVQFSF